MPSRSSNCVLVLLLLLGIIFCLNGSVLSTQNANISDDFTTEFAKSIIRRAKTADISALLNTRTAPCDDFYTYACGNWHRSNPAQLFNNLMTDMFQVTAKGFDRRLLKVLQSKVAEGSLDEKLQKFYQSCMLVHHDDVHYKLALENVYREYGEVPAIVGEQWNETDFDLWNILGRIQYKYGKQIIIAVDVMRDISNNTNNVVYLGPAEITIKATGVSGLLSEGSVMAKELQKYFGLDPKLAKKTADELQELEKKLSKGSPMGRDKSFHDLVSLEKVSKLEEDYGAHFNLSNFLHLVLGEDAPESIYIFDEGSVKSILKTVQETPKQVLANFVMWELLQEYLAKAAEDDMQRWCIGETKKYFGKYVDHSVYARYRTEATEAEVYSVWEQVRATFRQQLAGDKLDWIANQTRTKAIDKLEHMQLGINSYDNENFDQLFGDPMQIDRLNYVANVQQLLMAQQRQKLLKLTGKPSSLDATDVMSFTPVYNLLENNIRVPVALLQPRYFWDSNYPHALKYATLGYLIAHEMLHGFDDDGRNYDKSGFYSPWWDSKSRYEFEERRKCFQAQYHSYKYGGIQLPENIQQSENIADNGAIKLAYLAYQRWLDQRQETRPNIEQEETLTGLDLSNRQLFFVGFAQLWCEDVQTLFKSNVATQDTHAPGMYRVIGSLSNFQEFSWVFNCRQDAPMDPEYKCSIY